MARREKPSGSGDVSPRDALNLLEGLNGRVNSVGESYSRCCEAKDLLGLEAGNMQKL